MTEGIKDYKAYLDRYAKCRGITIAEAHTHKICRDTAVMYGVTEEELKKLDRELK